MAGYNSEIMMYVININCNEKSLSLPIAFVSFETKNVIFPDVAQRAVQIASASRTWRNIGLWYERYRCDRFMEAHKKEEKNLKPPTLQLFNIKGKVCVYTRVANIIYACYVKGDCERESEQHLHK